MTLRRCSYCAAYTSGRRDKAHGLVCSLCFTPFARQKPKPKPKKTRADRYRVSCEAFVASHAGYPLGAGYPSGDGLRRDGESHRAYWYRTLRDDPCSYCTRAGGTIDHIDPQAGPRPLYGLHSWLNVTGCCSSCNVSKGAEKLVLWLAARAVSAPRVRDD